MPIIMALTWFERNGAILLIVAIAGVALSMLFVVVVYTDYDPEQPEDTEPHCPNGTETQHTPMLVGKVIVVIPTEVCK